MFPTPTPAPTPVPQSAYEGFVDATNRLVTALSTLDNFLLLLLAAIALMLIFGYFFVRPHLMTQKSRVEGEAKNDGGLITLLAASISNQQQTNQQQTQSLTRLVDLQQSFGDLLRNLPLTISQTIAPKIDAQSEATARVAKEVALLPTVITTETGKIIPAIVLEVQKLLDRLNSMETTAAENKVISDRLLNDFGVTRSEIQKISGMMANPSTQNPPSTSSSVFIATKATSEQPIVKPES